MQQLRNWAKLRETRRSMDTLDSRQKNRIAGFSDMINGEPTVSGDFHFAGPHTVVASTWKRPGSLDDKVAVMVDLEEAFAKLAPSAD